MSTTLSRNTVHDVLAQFIRFASVGAIGTVAHYLVLAALVQLVGIHPVGASAVGFAVGATINYFLNYFLTFSSNIPHHLGMAKFFTVAVIGLGINSLIMVITVDFANLHYLLAQVTATFLVLAWNFTGNRLWTFRGTRYGSA
jgi:putative flippase GtrA